LRWIDGFKKLGRIMNKIKVCLAGVTGWAGSDLSKGISGATDMELTAAVSRNKAGKTLVEVIGVEGLDAQIFGTVEEALKTGPAEFYMENKS
jgi:4-hydroxy-tetrahydrodipicolinate reductase